MSKSLKKEALAVAGFLLALVLVNNSVAQRPENPGNGRNENSRDETGIQIDITFDSARHLVESYGLTGRKSLPPGIARNLARGKPLPPGLQLQRVPDIMLMDLPVIEGFEWNIAGDDLLLISLGTAIVEEVFRGVFR